MLFTLRQLQFFVALGDTSHLSRAAMHCHVSQPAMTTALKSLEQAVNVKLFVRHAHGVKLTAPGEEFLRRATSILNDANAAVETMQRPTRGPTGRVRIGVTETVSSYLLPNLMDQTRRRFPDLTVEFLELDRPGVERGLRRRDFDFAVALVSNFSTGKQLRMETLFRSPRRLWLAPSHPLAQHQTVSLREVAGQNYVMLGMDEHESTESRFWSAHGLTPRIYLQSNSIEAVRSIVGKGFGVAILSDLVYRPWSLEGDRLVRVNLKEHIPSMDVGVVELVKASLPEHAQLLREHVRALCLDA